MKTINYLILLSSYFLFFSTSVQAQTYIESYEYDQDQRIAFVHYSELELNTIQYFYDLTDNITSIKYIERIVPSNGDTLFPILYLLLFED